MNKIRDTAVERLAPAFSAEGFEGISAAVLWSAEHMDDEKFFLCMMHCVELARCTADMPSKPPSSWTGVKSLMNTSRVCAAAGARMGTPSGFGVFFGLSAWSSPRILSVMSQPPKGIAFMCGHEWGTICRTIRFASDMSYAGKLLSEPADDNENSAFSELLDNALRNGVPYGQVFSKSCGVISPELIWACSHLAFAQGHVVRGNSEQAEFFLRGAIRELS